VPFLKFSRDKRGYEHVYLVHATNRRGKPSRPRILYWYRSPPGVKVGRKPFDDEVRRTLEAQNPGVTFDWKAIVATPVPPPEPVQWRERRRVERLAKEARETEDVEPQFLGGPELPDDVADLAQAFAPVVELPVEQVPESVAPPPAPVTSPGARRRRRRGGRRRHGEHRQQNVVMPTGSEVGANTGDEDIQTVEVAALEIAEPFEADEPAEPVDPTDD
jgi:hypothetical protein